VRGHWLNLPRGIAPTGTSSGSAAPLSGRRQPFSFTLSIKRLAWSGDRLRTSSGVKPARISTFRLPLGQLALELRDQPARVALAVLAGVDAVPAEQVDHRGRRRLELVPGAVARLLDAVQAERVDLARAVVRGGDDALPLLPLGRLLLVALSALALTSSSARRSSWATSAGTPAAESLAAFFFARSRTSSE
jgi:hypothetical protein